MFYIKSHKDLQAKWKGVQNGTYDAKVFRKKLFWYGIRFCITVSALVFLFAIPILTAQEKGMIWGIVGFSLFSLLISVLLWCGERYEIMNGDVKVDDKSLDDDDTEPSKTKILQDKWKRVVDGSYPRRKFNLELAGHCVKLFLLSFIGSFVFLFILYIIGSLDTAIMNWSLIGKLSIFAESLLFSIWFTNLEIVDIKNINQEETNNVDSDRKESDESRDSEEELELKDSE